MGFAFHPATLFSDILRRARNVGDRVLDQRLILVGVSGVAKWMFLVGGPGVSARCCLSAACDVVSSLNGENIFSQINFDRDIVNASQTINIMQIGV